MANTGGRQHGSAAVRGRAAVVARLVGAVTVYWLGLAVMALWRPVTLYLAALRTGAGRAALGFSDQYGFAVTVDQQPIWRADLTALTVIASLVGPPLVLWLGWLAWAARQDRGRQRGRSNAPGASVGSTPRRAAPGPAQMRGGEPVVGGAPARREVNERAG
jgi:hypothetical protein